MPPETPPQSPKGPGRFSRDFALAMELPFLIVGTVVVGGFLGYLLDRWLRTGPVLLIVLGGLGFYAGLRETMRRLNTMGKPPKKGDDGGSGDAES